MNETDTNSATCELQRRRPWLAVSIFFCLVGIFLAIFLHWIIGLVVIFVSALIDRVHYICAGCGNTVAKTSRLCPACRAKLLPPGEYARYYRAQKKTRR